MTELEQLLVDMRHLTEQIEVTRRGSADWRRYRNEAMLKREQLHGYPRELREIANSYDFDMLSTVNVQVGTADVLGGSKEMFDVYMNIQSWADLLPRTRYTFVDPAAAKMAGKVLCDIKRPLDRDINPDAYSKAYEAVAADLLLACKLQQAAIALLDYPDVVPATSKKKLASLEDVRARPDVGSVKIANAAEAAAYADWFEANSKASHWEAATRTWTNAGCFVPGGRLPEVWLYVVDGESIPYDEIAATVKSRMGDRPYGADPGDIETTLHRDRVKHELYQRVCTTIGKHFNVVDVSADIAAPGTSPDAWD